MTPGRSHGDNPERPGPPTRSPTRWRAWVVLAALLLGGGWFTVAGYRVASAPPGLPGRFVGEFDALLEPYRAAQGPDAWAELATTITLKGQLEAEVWPSAPAGAPAGSPAPKASSNWRFDALYALATANDPGPTREEVDTAVQGLAAAERLGITASLARIAVTARVIRPSPPAQAMAILLPELGQIRYLARYCAGRMRLAAMTGSHAERVAAFEHALALGRIAACNFTCIDHLVGIAVHRLAFDRLRADLVDHPLPEPFLREALAAIDRQPLPSHLINLEGERLSMLDTIEWTHSDLPNRDGHYQPAAARMAGLLAGGPTGDPTDPHSWPAPAANLAGWFLPSKRQTTRKVNDLFDAVKRAAAAPRPARRAASDIDDWLARLPARFMLIRLVVPSLQRWLDQTDELALIREATRLALAIEIFRAARGFLPESLDQLAPDFLPSIPLDPFTGKPLVYRRLPAPEPGQTARVPGYLLYAVGLDGLDNGNTPVTSDPLRALRTPDPGFDFPLMPPAGFPR